MNPLSYFNSNLWFYAVFSGMCFGVWPLFMKNSGLQGSPASLVLGVSLILLPSLPAFTNLVSNFSNTNWIMATLAGFASAIGIWVYNTMLYKSKPTEVGLLFVIMVGIQVMVPILYQLFFYGNEITVRQLTGIFLTLFGIILMIL